MKLQIQSLLLALAMLGIATAAFAQDQDPIGLQSPSRFTETHVWIGLQRLNAQSDFWDDNFASFKASPSQLDSFTFGVDFIKHLDLHNAVMLSGNLYLNSFREPARNVLNRSGNPLEHHLDLNTFSLTAGYMFYPAGTQKPVIPYLGAGGGIYAGELRSYRRSFTTDDCDEDGNCTTKFIDSTDSSFLTFGYFALAGLEVPVSSHFALLVDGRYTVAHANLGGDFEDHGRLDLSAGKRLILETWGSLVVRKYPPVPLPPLQVSG
ncbi:MAG TPA: hypothetical protein VLV54_17790 [Thermoanaerobaculia bacterium]|nr:hypothetical protein [Thermoanaerobaculia bacterium]